MNRSELKQALLRGGLYLTLRQLVTMALSLTSVLVITRILGPAHYGWINIAIVCTSFIASLADMGLKVYLIRKPDDCSEQVQGEVLAFVLLSSGTLALMAVLMAPLIAGWTQVPQLQGILIVMAPVIVLDTCAGIPLGLLERTLQYQRSSTVEIGSLLLNYTVAIPLVLLKWDVWGVVVAYLLRSLFQFSLAFFFHPIRPRLPHHPKLLKAALQYGVGYSGAMWINQGRGLLIPLLIGRFMGANAVGLVAATTRIADLLAFMKTIAWQLGMSGFAKLQEDLPAMRQALSRAMTYQACLLIPPLGLFACLSPVLIPPILGQKWLGVATLFPYVGLAFLFKGIFDLHTLVLFALGRNRDVIQFNAINVVLVGTAIALLGTPFKIWGYAAAEMIALTTYFWLHHSIHRLMGSPDYRPLIWVMGCTLLPILLGNHLSPWVSVPLLITSFGLAFWISVPLRAIGQEIMTTFVQKLRTP